MLCTLPFSFDIQDSGIRCWNVYVCDAASLQRSKGRRVAQVAASDRSATFEIEDGLWDFYVLWETKDGVEQSIDDPAVAPVTARADSLAGAGPSLTETQAPDNAAVAPVDSTLTARVTFDAPASDDPPATVQIIEGSDAATGKILAEVPAVNAGPLAPDGGRQMSASFPVEGRPDADKVLTIRGISKGGQPAATSATRTLRTPPMDGFHEVALVTISGATHTGMPSPASTDGYEYDASDGLRLKLWPDDGSSYGSDYGDGTTGMVAEQPFGSACVCRATVESNELDVGAVATFRLSIVDTIARKTAAGLVGALETPPSYIPLDPMVDRDVNTNAGIGPLWLARETFADGSPRQPLRECRWEYVVGTSSPVAHADSDYKPYVAGQFVRGRYLRVRVVLKEPTGWHQIICPTASVTAQIPRTPTVVGSGSPEGIITRPPGHLYVDSATGVVYAKQSGLGNAGWVAAGGGSGAPTTADYLVKTADAGLSAERVVTDGTSITFDWSVGGVVVAKRAALTGDVTAAADSNATTIAAKAVTLAKMDDLATARIIGRNTAGTGVPEALATLPTGCMPALTGDVTTPGGSLAATVPAIGASLQGVPGQHITNTTAVTSLALGVYWGIYLGRAVKANPTITVVQKVTTGYAAGSGAHIGVAVGASSAGSAPTLTSVGTTDVSGTYNTTGIKTTAITTSGVNIGDELWFTSGCPGPTGTAFQVRGALADELQSGLTVQESGTDLASISSTAMSLTSAGVVRPALYFRQS